MTGVRRDLLTTDPEDEGRLLLLHKFESEDASTPNELEASLRIFEPVVRYLIVRDETVEQPAQAE